MLNLTEGQIKSATEDYLEYGLNQGAWWFTRLNSGKAFVKRGDKYYAIRLCEEGTADFMIIRARSYFEYCRQVTTPEVIFIEAKSATGRQRPAQKAFQILVESQGATYKIVRSFEELQDILRLEEG